MNPIDLNEFLHDHSEIDCRFDDSGYYFRNTQLPWYQHEGNYTHITRDKFASLDEKGLLWAVNHGLEVDHITRITGYFTKVSGWNKGKVAELRDRHREKDL